MVPVGLLWLPLLIWMGLIFFLSAQPHVPGPPQPLLDLILKKGSHIAGYGVLAALWTRALVGSFARQEIERRGNGDGGCLSVFGANARFLLIAWVVTVLYAISDEYHQGFVPGRHPGLADVVIDGLGAAAALLFGRQFIARYGLGNRDGDTP